MQDDKPGACPSEDKEQLHGALIFDARKPRVEGRTSRRSWRRRALPMAGGIVAHFSIWSKIRSRAVHGKNHGPHVFHGLNLRRDLRDHLWQGDYISQVLKEDAICSLSLSIPSSASECRSERPTDPDSVAVFPGRNSFNWSQKSSKSATWSRILGDLLHLFIRCRRPCGG